MYLNLELFHFNKKDGSNDKHQKAEVVVTHGPTSSLVKGGRNIAECVKKILSMQTFFSTLLVKSTRLHFCVVPFSF